MSRPPVTQVVRRAWTRRDALKATPIAAAGLAALGLAIGRHQAGAASEHRGTCRFCLMHCGLVATVRGGELQKVEGDLHSKTRGFLCEHGYALRELVHSGERIRHPLVRRGDAFHEVSWDEAFSEIATRLGALTHKEHLALQTGWPLVRHPLVGLLHRFARAFGTPNVATVASLCESTLRMGQSLTVGTKYAADVRAVKTLVVWGANPGVTAPPLLHVIADRARTGNLVVIDPVKTQLAREASVHLSIRPGTDGALALGLVRQVVKNEQVDRAWLANHTRGFDELLALSAPYTPERVQALTSVPAADLERVARMLGERPTSIWQGLGVEHHENGVQTTRAIASLEVLCGRFDGSHEAKSELTRPQRADGVLPSLPAMRTPQPVPPELATRPIGGVEFPLYETWNREAQAGLFPEAIERGALRALVLWASNPLVTSPGTARLEQAFEKLELLVAVDPFLTASARRADVVLPAGTFAEAADDEGPALVEPQGGARADYEILRGLAHACGLATYFPWKTLPEALAAPHVSWMADQRVQPAFAPRHDTPQFGTTSGLVEFSSGLLAEAGHAAVPEWTAPSSVRTPEFPLWLVSGPRPRARINSQFSQSAMVRARLPEPEALLHPEVARAHGLVDGGQVEVISAQGRITLLARVSADVHPECVVVPSGWEEANPNRLIDPRKRDPISGFPAFRSGTCRVEPHGAGRGA